MRTKLLLTFLALAFGSLLTLKAQDAPASSEAGRLAGVIVDRQSGQPVPEASLLILENGYFERSDFQGRYLIKDLPGGTYTLRVFKQGYDPFDVTGVEVIGGQVNALDIGLPRADADPEVEEEVLADLNAEEIFELDVLEVTAEEVKSVGAGLLLARQRSVSISDAIGSDAFSQLNLGDAAEALTKVPGASVVDGKYVLIRGLGDRYSNTLLNGASVPSADPDRRAVQMDQFPSDLLQSIETSKSFTPDKPGAFSGGSVNVRTKPFPDEFIFSAGGSVKYNTEITGEDILEVPGGGRDWLAMDDGTRDFPAVPEDLPSFSLARTRALQGDLGPARVLTEFTRGFHNETYYPTEGNADPAFGFNVTVGDRLDLSDDRAFGYTVNFTWDNGFDHIEAGILGRYQLDVLQDEILTRLVYSPDIEDYTEDLRNNIINFPDSVDDVPPLGYYSSTGSVSWGFFSKLAYLASGGHEFSVDLLWTQSADDVVSRGVGQFVDSDTQLLYEIYDLLYTERSVGSIQFNGKSYFAELNDLEVDYRASFGISTQDQPDYRTMGIFHDLRRNRIGTASGASFDRFFRDLDEDLWEVGADATYPLGDLLPGRDAKLKFGGMYSESTRDYVENTFGWRQSPRTNEDYRAFPGPQSELGYNEATGTWGNVLEPVVSLNSYTADQTVWAAYVMSDMYLATYLRTIFGLRYESTEMNTDPVDAAGVTLNPGTIEQEDVLPAIHLIYEYSESVNLRAAYGRTFARPTFRELADVRVNDPFREETYQGDPEIEMTTIDNFDLRWEWFPRDGETIAVSAFYKMLELPIEVLIEPRNGAVRPRNVEEGTVYGLEFEFRKRLDFIDPALENLSFNMNFSWIESEVEIPEDELAILRSYDPDVSDTRELLGQSPYTFNADLTYAQSDWGTTFTIAFNVVGERLHLVTPDATPDYFERPFPKLDFFVSKDFWNGWTMKLGVENIMNSDRETSFDFDGEVFLYELYKDGTSISLGVSYSY